MQINPIQNRPLTLFKLEFLQNLEDKRTTFSGDVITTWTRIHTPPAT